MRSGGVGQIDNRNSVIDPAECAAEVKGYYMRLHGRTPPLVA